MNSDNLVPDVPYRGYDDAEHELYLDTIVALDRDDYHTAAELKLEQAHRDMIRRDAMLSNLAKAVMAGDAEKVEEYARGYATSAHWLDRDIETAREWAECAERSSEMEAER